MKSLFSMSKKSQNLKILFASAVKKRRTKYVTIVSALKWIHLIKFNRFLNLKKLHQKNQK